MQSNAAAPSASLTREEILRELQDSLKEILNLETTATLRPEAQFREDLHCDSLAMVDIVIGVEEAFGIKLRSDLDLFEEIRTTMPTDAPGRLSRGQYADVVAYLQQLGTILKNKR